MNVYSLNASWTESKWDNNGNLRKQMIYVPNDYAISGWWDTAFFYDYDALNRLYQAREARGGQNRWVQYYDYDRWGNRTVNAANTWDVEAAWDVPEPQYAASASTNRLSAPAGYTMQYDAAGNLTYDNFSGGGARGYDAEGRMTQAQFVSGQTQTAAYTYDADGRRVRRTIGAGGTVWQAYGMDGELLAEYAAGSQPSQPQKEYGYRAGELLVTAEGGGVGGGAATNLALNKAASQSSTGWDSPAGRAVDGDTNGDWYAGSVSHTGYEYQAWWQVDLGAIGSLERIEVYLMTVCCSSHTNFDVMVSDDGANWSGYYVAGPVDQVNVAVNQTGRYVRVQLRGADYLALAEVKVIGTAGGAPAAGGVRWLVSDQLGTPRVVIDQTGSLAGVRRHDYLPFGEEIGAGIGGRTTQQGYSGNDGVRQGFTGYEKDGETGLNFAQSRYHSPVMGRFTSPDKLFADQYESDPQSWNLYVYAGNNPLLFTDPSGMWKWYEPEKNGKRFLQWEDKDDWKTLAKFLRQENPGNIYSPKQLEAAFGGGGGLGPALIVDVAGAVPSLTNQRGVENVSFDTLSNITPAGRGAKAAGGIFSWLRNAFGKMFGKKAATEAALKLTVGTRTTVNAAQLRSVARQSLESDRLKRVKELIDPSATKEGPVKVTPDGVIVEGHHRARAWAERGQSIEVEVVPARPGYNVNTSRPILELPVP